MQSFSWRRVLLALLAVGYVVLGGLPHAANAQVADPDAGTKTEITTGDVTTGGEGDQKCPDGQDLKDGECVPVGCSEPQVADPVTGKCEDPAPKPEPCPDGSQPVNGSCPSPCPDGADQCGQFRSCPVDTPLPPGSTCEPTPSTTTTVPPVPPAPTPPSDGNVFGRPVGEQSSGAGGPSRPRAAVEGIQIGRGGSPQLATTGLPDVLMLSAIGLIAAGAGMVAWVRRRDRSMLLG